MERRGISNSLERTSITLISHILKIGPKITITPENNKRLLVIEWDVLRINVSYIFQIDMREYFINIIK